VSAALWVGIAAAANYTATWTIVSTTTSPGAPVWRGWSAMTWADSQSRIVLWGGSGAVFLNDITGFNPVNTTWTTYEPNVACPGNTMFFPPNGSDESGVVFDPVNDLLWVFVGGSGYRCATTQAVGRTAGAGTTSAAIVDPTLSATTNDYYKDWIVRVSSGAKVRVVSYAASTKTLALVASVGITPGAPYDLYVDFGGGTWSYDFVTGQYNKLASRYWGYAGYQPPGRLSPGFAADGTKAILFGGLDYDNGTYVLDFASQSWAVAIGQGSASSPPARGQIENQFAYDTGHGRFVLFGGRCFDPARCTYQGMLDDTWLYNPASNSWMKATPATRPSARNQGQMYYDAANGVVVLYGGIGAGGTVLNDLWTFDVATLSWTQQAMPATNPGGVFLGQVSYAPTTQCGYLVYGMKPAGATNPNTWKLCLQAAGGNTPPIASFTTTPSSTTVGSPIALSAAGSSDPGGSIISYAWNFGDGTTGSGVSTSKSYAVAGTYTITLTVTDNGGLAASTTRTVTITTGNQAPTANFSASPSPTTVGTPITFSAATSFDPDGSIASYAWNFGDGTTGSGVSATKSYATAGTFTVTLTVTDNGGLTGTTTGTMTVTTGGGGTTTVWVEDALPAGAVAGGSEAFTWITSNPTPYSGTKAHQSPVTSGVHQHYFTNASTGLAVNTGDTLFAYVYLDPANPPREVVLQWYDGSWEHRAYWGANLISWAGGGGAGGRYMGALPASGQWVKLSVSAALLGLEGRTLNGMAFTLYDGRATWDYAGKTSSSGNQPPVASFTTTPSSTTVGSPIALSAAASSDPDGSITSYAWNFGDTTTASGVSTSKAYAAAGTYTITLTVTDNGGRTASTTRTVTITSVNQPPVASFTTTPSSTTVGSPIALSAAGSSDPGGSITNYAWTFGDGTTGSGVSTSKTYAAAGTYTITLTVTDNGGLTASTARTVTITAGGGGTTTVWVEDALPAGAIAGGSEAFTWISANPTPHSGTKAHQSPVTGGLHQHYFTSASATLAVGVGDTLFAYVYLDPANPPREVVLQWYDGSWEHRAYWGANLIGWAGGGGVGGRYMGTLPTAGQWVRLSVPAALVGLEGRTLNGMAFTLYDGRATWDYAGKTSP
jgi:PKD repeat protein